MRKKKLLPEKEITASRSLLYFLVIFIVCSTHVSDDLPYISCYPPSPNILPQLQKMRRSVPWKIIISQIIFTLMNLLCDGIHTYYLSSS